ncbi:hypothetical protein LTR10_022296 [Elasticomyces elasticus]|uniref:BZIP domain-containing protein n=1 Tax=Exophiala sideris TaxID=1016849 RepID=A0ABR0J6Y0_9EURO|nr:hypothetical protein LTR10_022296 [Elasticomyces elasticus]KAK5028794.1 hypothetical protein LTS07_006173 [Exophiala sideris]KAK5035663.1 hypothetical protein LTR13_005792 [Exophiala sideris]KAK5057298.1 hypothetical protein LTR69_007337 [Exophiala sideris]KAK5181729.1 hypothetical protein LTR44_005929 [Eurotiomycetes sp. CCFEE 6388]
MSPKDTTAMSRSSDASHRRSADMELQRKRARDRKSQQAMRDRAKWTLESLMDQVAQLHRALEQEGKRNDHLQRQISTLEKENERLQAENAAVQLRLLSEMPILDHPSALSFPLVELDILPEWQRIPFNSPPTCLSDQILQSLVEAHLRDGSTDIVGNSKPDLLRLVDIAAAHTGSVNDVVLDIVKSYAEIDSLPKQVAVHFVMFRVMRWMVLQDEESWNQLPQWLRPIPEQITTTHPAWIDRIPWPRARQHLIAHPEIQLDDFAAVYSSGFQISWAYDAKSVLLTLSPSEGNARHAMINPVYEEHITQLQNWKVGDALRHRFPALAEAIDQDCQPGPTSTPLIA